MLNRKISLLFEVVAVKHESKVYQKVNLKIACLDKMATFVMALRQ